ncbi:hypothetical protein O181_052897 [Austropuccinia psidii MF-1]|uniref:Uncharacterized protein n=1 Tax=Austropuccinia psidii MF-1 TaxID=1389203 RepID=A0A9Q3E8M5_9BASI|nr:hypothetical protein [Austropuccinia psidii MF-1]
MTLEAFLELIYDDSKTPSSENDCSLLHAMKEEINKLKSSHAESMVNRCASLKSNSLLISQLPSILFPEYKENPSSYNSLMQSPQKATEWVPILLSTSENYDT